MRKFTFPRTQTIEITPLAEDVVGVKAVLLDPFHHIELNLELRAPSPTDLSIAKASAVMERVPYPVCREPLGRVPQLVGLKVERGLRRKVTRLLGGPEGCVHLVELTMEGVRLAIQGVVVIWTEALPPEEAKALQKQVLGGVCIAYPR